MCKLFEISCQLTTAGELCCIDGGQTILADETFAQSTWKFGHRLTNFFNPACCDDKGREVWVWEIAIVVRVFFAAHAACFVTVRVVEAGLLDHFATVLDQFDLTADLVLNRSLEEAKRIHVFNFAARAEFFLAFRTHRYVGVHTKGSLLHVAIANSKPHN